jgi:hypothetical protein
MQTQTVLNEKARTTHLTPLQKQFCAKFKEELFVRRPLQGKARNRSTNKSLDAACSNLWQFNNFFFAAAAAAAVVPLPQPAASSVQQHRHRFATLHAPQNFAVPQNSTTSDEKRTEEANSGKRHNTTINSSSVADARPVQPFTLNRGAVA